MKVKAAFLIATLLVTIPFSQGCSSRKSTTITKTEVSQDAGSESARSRYADSGGTQTTTTETKSEESHDDHSHGGLFSIVGDIIALPFRAVGALLSAIF